jgi:hypothetical protein
MLRKKVNFFLLLALNILKWLAGFRQQVLRAEAQKSYPSKGQTQRGWSQFFNPFSCLDKAQHKEAEDIGEENEKKY